MTTDQARREILAIIAQIPTQDLPRWKERKDGCLWFRNLSMGYYSMSNPENATNLDIDGLFACEAAAREFQRRAQVAS